MLTINYNGIKVNSGNMIPSHKVQLRPQITFEKKPGKFYTTVLVDPDAPTRINPVYKYWLHWLVVNNDEIIMPYQGPSPPIGSGPHNYVFIIYEQENPIHVEKIRDRPNFKLDQFEANNKLKFVASNYFVSMNN